MKAWVFVEGAADQMALQALWRRWMTQLQSAGVGIAVIRLSGKPKFLKRLGPRVAEKLVASDVDIVVGLPDLHPTQPFANTPLAHRNHDELCALQTRLVKEALYRTQGVMRRDVEAYIHRFHASVLKHDLEMLLLAARDQLRARLGTNDQLGQWREPVEDQDLGDPPKQVVQRLFLAKSKARRAYRETVDAPAVLGQVQDVSEILRTRTGNWTCPVFVRMLRWLGEKLGSPCCQLD